jgi:hypothetical protein
MNSEYNTELLLSEMLSESFSTRELYLLCFDLDISFDELEGTNTQAKVRALVRLMIRHGRLESLIAYCQRERPDVNWATAVDHGGVYTVGNALVGRDSTLTALVLSPLRLDTALPSRVVQHRSFELAVAIRQPESPVLQEVDLDQTRSGELQVEWPEDAGSIALRIQISAPECTIQKDSCSFRLYRDKDSPIFYFHLIPQQGGRIGIIVTVYQEQEWLGGARLHTVAQEQVVGKVYVNVHSRTIRPDRAAQVAVAQRIEELFTAAQLRTLCFDLGVNYDNLEGTTLAEKARSLVGEMVRTGRFHELVRACQELRPNLDWEALAGIVPAGGREE